MKIIEISKLENGGHRNQDGALSSIPAGWAVIPEDIKIPDTFPFVEIEVEGDVVVSMTAGVVPQETEQEKATKEIAELKTKLAETDYQAIKYAEGALTGEEYAETKAQRQAWRDRINELEAIISGE